MVIQPKILFSSRSNRGLRMPVLVICPKNPDSLKYNMILRDIGRRLPHLDRLTVGRLISFAIAGAGFSNVGQFMKKRILQNISEQEACEKWNDVWRFIHFGQIFHPKVQRLYSLFRRWKGHRTLSKFYEDLFEKYGYTCQDVSSFAYN
jgi:hypothetical protein